MGVIQNSDFKLVYNRYCKDGFDFLRFTIYRPDNCIWLNGSIENCGKLHIDSDKWQCIPIGYHDDVKALSNALEVLYIAANRYYPGILKSLETVGL